MKKNGFLTFVFSCIPGTGQLYQGHMKKGVSIMAIFYGLILISGLTGIGSITTLLPIVWFYAFFDAINKISLTVEELNAIEDKPILISEESFNRFLKGRHTFIGVVVILLGLLMLLYMFEDNIVFFLTQFTDKNGAREIVRGIPKIITSVGIIIFGVSIIRKGKKQ